MLIPVIYLNGKQDMVKGFYLNDLIERQQIRKFKRRDGWVALPSDKIRSAQNEKYSGPERREQSIVEATVNSSVSPRNFSEEQQSSSIPTT